MEIYIINANKYKIEDMLNKFLVIIYQINV